MPYSKAIPRLAFAPTSSRDGPSVRLPPQRLRAGHVRR